MAEQLLITDEAIAARDEGLARAVGPLSDQALADADRIIRRFADSADVFTADDLRPLFDLACIPTASRGVLIRNAVAKGLIKRVGYRPSALPSVHHKVVGVYAGALQHEEAR